MLKTTPAVFAVKDTYQIMVPVCEPCLCWVEINEQCFEDATNGILRSDVPVHCVSVPMNILDASGSYTVYTRPIINRKPYFTQTDAVRSRSFSFRSIPRSSVRLYHISDAHERLAEPIAAAKAFGEIDLLILNGDLLNHAGDADKFIQIYQLIEAITHGEIPVVYARGNHDTRGRYAERMEQYTPKHRGATYYTFQLGSLWGMILDCAEDKPDDHAEYGFTVSCHQFREQQTAFLKEVIDHAETEYAADGVQTRMILCHNPFVNAYKPPFDIEYDLYRTWAHTIQMHIQPHFMLCGHVHKTYVQTEDDDRNRIPLPCPLIVGAMPTDQGFTGCGLEIRPDHIDVAFTDHTGRCDHTYKILK